MTIISMLPLYSFLSGWPARRLSTFAATTARCAFPFAACLHSRQWIMSPTANTPGCPGSSSVGRTLTQPSDARTSSPSVAATLVLGRAPNAGICVTSQQAKESRRGGRAAHNEVCRGELGPLAGGETDRACLGEGVDVFAEDNVYPAGEAAPLHVLAEFLWVDVAKKHISAVDDGDFRVLFGSSLKQTLELE